MTSTATIRFYAELNDLLSSVDRQQDIPYRFAVAPSVKDAIESLGVPHTEVDLVLANGVSVDFGYRLGSGDLISVYPVFERFDITDLTRVRAEPLHQVRFVVDGRLGTLARRLRLLGFDTRFEVGWSDEELAGISVDEQRILLARDRKPLKRRAVTHGLLIRHDDPDQQVVDVVRRLHLAAELRPFTRCTACNGELEDVDKDSVVDRLEPLTRDHFDVFTRCRSCGRVYWEGSHHRRLSELVERVRAEGAGEPVKRSRSNSAIVPPITCGGMTPPPMAGWNLALRFGLELGALVGLGAAAWNLTSGRTRPVAVVAAPAGAAAVWGVFNVLDDPSRSGAAPIEVPGSARLAIELCVLGGGAAGIAVAGRPKIAAGFAILIAAQYATSWSRVRWLLRA